MVQYEVSAPQEGMSLINFLVRTLPGAGMNLLYKQLRKKNINLNSKKATGREKLRSGDLVQVYFSDETVAKFERGSSAGRDEGRGENAVDLIPLCGAKGDIRVLYEDEDIIAVDKAAGVLSQSERKGQLSLNEELIAYLLKKGEVSAESLKTVRPAVCNRLDRNTSGIVLCGKTMRGLISLSEQVRERGKGSPADNGKLLPFEGDSSENGLVKKYLCIIKGTGEGLTDRMRAFITKDRERNISRVSEKPLKDDSVDIETGFWVKESRICDGVVVTLLEVRLYTGRSHQIRAHLSYLGYPLAGDVKYGDKSFNRFIKDRYGVSRQLLHASYVRLGDGREINSPEPEDFLWLHGLPEA